jgi:DNA-binding NarL/FixJ family response regulator
VAGVTGPVRVLIVDDDPLVRAGLTMILKAAAELLVVGEAADGAEIAAELFMSVATVKTHVSHMLTKLDLNNRTQIALLAHDAANSP